MKKAFTLLELLVSVAVIGMLLSLLLPAFARVRENARRAQCANNLRQIGVAWYLYLDDNDERFPIWGNPARLSPPTADLFTWGGKTGIARLTSPADVRVLNRYLDIYFDNDTAALEVFHCPSDRGSYTSFGVVGNSYRMSSMLLSRSISSITDSFSKLILVKDFLCDHGQTGYGGSVLYENVLFLDGHVKTHKIPTDIDSGEIIGN